MHYGSLGRHASQDKALIRHMPETKRLPSAATLSHPPHRDWLACVIHWFEAFCLSSCHQCDSYSVNFSPWLSVRIICAASTHKITVTEVWQRTSSNIHQRPLICQSSSSSSSSLSSQLLDNKVTKLSDFAAVYCWCLQGCCIILPVWETWTQLNHLSF